VHVGGILIALLHSFNLHLSEEEWKEVKVPSKKKTKTKTKTINTIKIKQNTRDQTKFGK
jgi:hypothetical protein